MKFAKNGQFFILSGLFMVLLVIYIYSLETDNTYISSGVKTSIYENVVYETCMIGRNSNSSNIDSRFGSFSLFVMNYCEDFSNECILEINLKPGNPPGGNMSLLNYTHYSYELTYTWDNYTYYKNFTC